MRTAKAKPEPLSATQLRVAALKLLTRRDYSCAEMTEKLRPLTLSAAELGQVIAQLMAENLLSDPRYAQQRVIARGRRYGNLRLSHELKQKGVAPEDIAEAIDSGDDEFARCKEVWLRKFSGVVPQTRVEQARQMRLLQYRGFSSAVIFRIFKFNECD